MLAAAPSSAQPAVQATSLDPVLDRAADAPTLRARLFAFADSMRTIDPQIAAEALAVAGQSFARTGELDSAVACFERALPVDPREPRRLDLAGALLSRLAPGDAVRARDVLRPIQPMNPDRPLPNEAPTQGLFAWAHFLAGRSDSAARFLAPLDSWLSVQPEWRYRLGCVAFDRQEWIRVQVLLVPLAVQSRAYDQDVMDQLKRSAEELNAGTRLLPMLQREVILRDKVEDILLTEMAARRVAFRARDGFPLGGTVLAPKKRAGTRGVVVVMEPGDTLALYDSLAVGLRNMGLAVMLLHPRGSGRSVAPSCPLPSAWHGREARMLDTVAGDVATAAAALARETGADSSQYLVVGVGSTGPVAILAARKDRRVRALMLVSPTAAPSDRGALNAAVAGWKHPIYFQTGPEDFPTWPWIDVLYSACDPRASRVADSDRPGTRAKLFRRDPRIMERFKKWLAEAWPRSAAPRATRPATPRPG
jgi:alpha-beta hydrolase superfamily lysophospholipase